MLSHANDNTFSQEVLQHHGIVLVEFFTQSCGPCRALEPALQNLAREFLGRAKIVKVDSERSPGVASHFGVRMAPTFVLFRNGQALQTIQGAPPSHRLKGLLTAYL